MIFHTRFLEKWNYYEVPCEQRLRYIFAVWAVVQKVA